MRWFSFMVGVLFMQGVLLGLFYAYHLRGGMIEEYSVVSEHFKSDFTKSFEHLADSIPDELRSFKDTEKLLPVYRVSNIGWARLLNLYAGAMVLSSSRVYVLGLLCLCACAVLYLGHLVMLRWKETYDIAFFLGVLVTPAVMLGGCFVGYLITGLVLNIRGAWVLNLL